MGEQLSRGLRSLERCFKAAREQRGEKRRGRDSRKPTIGSLVIACFQWSASQVSLPGGS